MYGAQFRMGVGADALGRSGLWNQNSPGRAEDSPSDDGPSASTGGVAAALSAPPLLLLPAVRQSSAESSQRDGQDMMPLCGLSMADGTLRPVLSKWRLPVHE